MTTAILQKKTSKAKRQAKAPVTKKREIDPARKSAVDALCGLCADMDYSVDDYLREKHAGVDAENAMAEQIRREKEKKRLSVASDIADIKQIR